MKQVFDNILNPMGLAPTNIRRGRALGTKGYVVTSRTKGKSWALVINEAEIVAKLNPGKASVYVGTYANKKLADNAGKALMARKAQILAAKPTLAVAS